MSEPNKVCPEASLARLGSIAADDSGKGLRKTEELLGKYPGDARLHFLQGSLLAALARYPEALPPMHRAIELAPGFAVARFQLGLLHLSSGSLGLATEVWSPLSDLNSDDALRLFAEGLQHMAADRFADASRLLRRGIAQNLEHPAINGDMMLVLERLEAADAAPGADAASSEAHWLLNLTNRGLKH